MGKRIIISESQYEMLKVKLNERTYQQNLVKKIVGDLNANYKRALQTYEDRVSQDFRQKKVFEVIVSGEIIAPIDLSLYMQKKYSVGNKFMEQLLNDWCDDKINDELLSKYVNSDE